MPKPSVVGGRLRELREKRGLSVADLARMSGVDRNAISMVENGSSNAPSFPNGVRLALALNADPAYLAGVDAMPLGVSGLVQSPDQSLAQVVEALRQEVLKNTERQDLLLEQVQGRLRALEATAETPRTRGRKVG